MTDLMTISYFYTVKNDLSENTIRTMLLLADYIQQSQGSVNTVDYHKTPVQSVFAFIHTTRASIFCKGTSLFRC